MGIPSYFSYIVKNHANIIRKIEDGKFKANNLYLDANSIIYDCIHKIDFTKLTESDTDTICAAVFNKIDEYIALLNPDNNIFIAFDGVAPVAKLEQQRQRRYKSQYQNKINKEIYKGTKADPWNTTAITPGTIFMAHLNSNIRKRYNDPAKYNVKNLILSPSDRYGEGEHKLFEYIRAFPDQHRDMTTVIYGLDADLIMLSINHLPVSDKIFLFRETPHFIQTINRDLEPDSNYLIDIPELANIITLNMNNGEALTTVQQKNRIYDYIFMCFFLGNDFMPHFPSINIRTGGVDKMLNAYKATIGGTDDNLTDGKTIYWKNVRKLVACLAAVEEENLKAETKSRDRREHMQQPTTTEADKLARFDSIPNHERAAEKYINPFTPNWRARYYKQLFDFENADDTRKKQVCMNYLEGLEWNMKYYTSGCPDWRWCYKYDYPPLLCDLINYVQYFETTLVEKQTPAPVLELTQLCYVLPKDCMNLVPSNVYNAIMEKHSDWYKSDCEFVWAYCRHFWESHVQLPEIDIVELECIIQEVKNKIVLSV